MVIVCNYSFFKIAGSRNRIVRFRILRPGIFCAEKNLKNIDDMDHYKLAAIDLAKNKIVKESENHPSGCSISYTGLVTFNPKKVGKRHENYYSICYNAIGK